ncbi:MAG: GNAT family N-acetyltransferase [Planctomycetota bacterium]
MPAKSFINVPYSYIRAVEVEGRHPEDAGVWCITACRLHYGEGLPLPSDPAWSQQVAEGGELPPSHKIPRGRLHSDLLAAYRMVPTGFAAYESLARKKERILIGLPLSPNWIAPDNGIIEPSDPPEIFFDRTHCVSLDEWMPGTPLFHFRNSWGDWGLNGSGYLHIDYFDRFVFESFAFVPSISSQIESTHVSNPFRFGTVGTGTLKRRVTRAENDDRFYSFVIGQDDKNKFGWAFVRERHNVLDLEDIYVRPEFRGNGIGGQLLSAVKSLRNLKSLPLRIPIHWPESERENPDGFRLTCKLVSQMGCTFVPNSFPKAAYVAFQGTQGLNVPEAPSPYPHRPRAPLGELILAAALLILTPFTYVINGREAIDVPKARSVLTEPQIDRVQRAFDTINPERYELILKKNRQGLTEKEHLRLNMLQTHARSFADLLAPIDTSIANSIKELLIKTGGPSL